MKNRTVAFCMFLSIAAWMPVSGFAQKVETVVEGLHNPTSIAIQPETGHVFVAESGALRVIRIVDGAVEPVIIGFPKDAYGKAPVYDIGPLGLLFLDKDTLVVGGGGNPDGKELLRVFKVPAVGDDPISAEKTEGESQSLPATDDVPGEGNFFGLAKNEQGILVTCNGNNTQGWIALATLEANKLKTFERHIATRKATGVDAPVAITISPENFIAVGQMGKVNLAGDSLLTFYRDGEMKANFKLDINDISGLAYGPKHGRLFATDFNWLDASQGGLYKIVRTIDEKICKTVKIATLKKPTALAFNFDGDLLITLAGNTPDGSKKPNGKLVVIKKLDVDPKEK